MSLRDYLKPRHVIPIVLALVVALGAAAYVAAGQDKSNQANKPPASAAQQKTQQKSTPKQPAAKPPTTEYCLKPDNVCFYIPKDWEPHTSNYNTTGMVDFWQNNTSGRFTIDTASLSNAGAVGGKCPDKPYTHGEVFSSEELPIKGMAPDGSPQTMYIGKRIFYGSAYSDLAEYFLTTDPAEAKPGTFSAVNGRPCPSTRDTVVINKTVFAFSSSAKSFYPNNRKDAIDTLGSSDWNAAFWDTLRSIHIKQ